MERGKEKIVKAVNDHINHNLARHVFMPEIGTITAEGLLLDTWPHVITDYLVARWDTLCHYPPNTWPCTTHIPANNWNGEFYCPHAFDGIGATVETTHNLGANTIPNVDLDLYEHTIKNPQEPVRVEFRPHLYPGDRVLVVALHHGQDYIVICKLDEG